MPVNPIELCFFFVLSFLSLSADVSLASYLWPRDWETASGKHTPLCQFPFRTGLFPVFVHRYAALSLPLVFGLFTRHHDCCIDEGLTKG